MFKLVEVGHYAQFVRFKTKISDFQPETSTLLKTDLCPFSAELSGLEVIQS